MIITLMGYMGSGKTTFGKQLARKLSYHFFDLDAEIEKNEGLSISEIFSEKGEAYFRETESKILTNLLRNKNDVVLSLGGGTPCFFNNLDLIKKQSLSVYIKLPVKTLAQRLQQSNKNKRPLISGLNSKELNDLIKKQSLSVYIKLPVKTLAQRLQQSNKNKRPLISGLNSKELNDFIEKQLIEREKFYLQADVVIEPLNEKRIE